MRALMSHVAGGPESLVIEDVALPEPGPGEVRIAVRAAALNFPDLLLIQDLYQARPPRPFVPGSECAGTIEAIGTGVTGFGIGDPVIAMAAWGAFAEHIVVPAAGCLLVPAGIGFDAAAAALVTYGTSHYALRTLARIAPGETLLVLGGAGGVGLAAVELGRAFGARVIAAVSSEAKAAAARDAGADATVVYPAGPLDKAEQRAFGAAVRAAAGGPVDVVVDPVGGAYAEPALRALGWGGRYLVIGFTAGVPSVPLNLPLLKGSRIIGVFYGEFTKHDPAGYRAHLDELLAMLGDGRISPRIGAHVPFAQAIEAFRMLAERRATGKIVLTFDDAG